jgi:hypothetical protein
VLTFVRLAFFAMFVVALMMSLAGAAMLSLAIAAPNLQLNSRGEIAMLLYAPFVAVGLGIAFSYAESVARRWPNPPA